MEALLFLIVKAIITVATFITMGYFLAIGFGLGNDTNRSLGIGVTA